MKGERHPEVLALLDEDPPLDREELLHHLQTCVACRGRLAAEDPSRLFGLLALAPPPQAILDRVSRGVARAMAEEEPPAARSRWLVPAASLAAALVLAGFFATYVLRHEAEPNPEQAAALAPRREVVETEARFELLASPGQAQVVDLAVGEVQLVMIFDERLDL